MSAAANPSAASPALAQVQESLKTLVSGPKLKEAGAFAARLFEHLRARPRDFAGALTRGLRLHQGRAHAVLAEGRRQQAANRAGTHDEAVERAMVHGVRAFGGMACRALRRRPPSDPGPSAPRCRPPLSAHPS